MILSAVIDLVIKSIRQHITKQKNNKREAS